MGGPMVYQPSGSVVETKTAEMDESFSERYGSSLRDEKQPRYFGHEIRSFDVVAHRIENAIEAMR
jgi:hypothetical protein